MAIWTWGKIRQLVRDLSGRKSVTQMSDAGVVEKINDYYVNVMPLDLELESLDAWWTQDTAAGVDTYPVASSYLLLRPPLTVGGYPLVFYDDPVRFQAKWRPSGEPYAQARPHDALLYGRQLLLRPSPDTVYTVKAGTIKIPDGFTDPNAGPPVDAWARLIAYGTAILIFGEAGQREQVESLGPAYATQKNLVQRPALKQMQNFRGQPRW